MARQAAEIEAHQQVQPAEATDQLAVWTDFRAARRVAAAVALADDDQAL